MANNVLHSSAPVKRGPVDITIFSDARLDGWGGTNGRVDVGGRWTESELPTHINALELQAAKLTLLALAKDCHDVHVRLMVDNTTAASYINKWGVPIRMFVMQSQKRFGSGRYIEIFGSLRHMFQERKT